MDMTPEKRENEKPEQAKADDGAKAGDVQNDRAPSSEKPNQEGDAANAAVPSPDEGGSASAPTSGESGRKRTAPVRAGGHVLTKKGWQPEEIVRRRRPGYKLVNGGWVRDPKSKPEDE